MNYKELLNKIEFLMIDKTKENEELRNTRDIIELDINRTHFETNVDQNRKVTYKFFLLNIMFLINRPFQIYSKL